jgi:hypothetical protein
MARVIPGVLAAALLVLAMASVGCKYSGWTNNSFPIGVLGIPDADHELLDWVNAKARPRISSSLRLPELDEDPISGTKRKARQRSRRLLRGPGPL